MIFITGDIHGDPTRFSTKNFLGQKEMTKDDYVIILGDFGLVWEILKESDREKFWLDWLDEKPFTTLFIDGNHENFDRLNMYPIEKWHGGSVHKIRPSVMHLMRGEVFEINGLTFLAMGGARSHDIEDGILDFENDLDKIESWSKDFTKRFRINHYSWWEEEIPSDKEIINAYNNLKVNKYKVDYVLSHEGPASSVLLKFGGFYKPDKYSTNLENIRNIIGYKHWYFGHYHCNSQINEKESILYENIIQIQ